MSPLHLIELIIFSENNVNIEGLISKICIDCSENIENIGDYIYQIYINFPVK